MLICLFRVTQLLVALMFSLDVIPAALAYYTSRLSWLLCFYLLVIQLSLILQSFMQLLSGLFMLSG